MLRTLPLILLLVGPAAWAQVTVELDETVIAPKTQIGLGVNGTTSWYNVVGANMVDDPSFEGAPQDGFARAGWPWSASGELTGAVDTADAVSGAQCQRVVVHSAPAHIGQGRTTLPQLPHVRQALPTHTYRIKAMVKASRAGARVRFGLMDEGWQCRFGADVPVTTEWAAYAQDVTPSSQHLLRGFCVGFSDTTTYWIDDLLAWNIDDLDPATGLSATFVARLKELAPASLRLGGLGVNGIPLESYLRRFWGLSYGPPALGPDFDLNTFLRLCREVGAIPFITVPPAFSDSTSWKVGDLTDHVIANVYADHGNLVDYIGGDNSTPYGARREADGHSRWDLEFEAIYFELGNELWGTPDNRWDMDPNNNEDQRTQMENYATYCERRMTEMRGRPGWRSTMKVGFGGRSPTSWIGDWPGSYNTTLVPAIGQLTDFSTIDLYYGDGVAGTDPDAAVFAALFANAVKHEREIAAMKAAFAAANGGQDIETTVYEGNATWGDGAYQTDLGNPTPQYFMSVSLGAAVSLVDVYAAANRAGLTINNHFHYGGNIWGATGPYPEVVRKPAFHALTLFTRHLDGDLVTCTVSGGDTFDEPLSSEQAVPYLACYPYKRGAVWRVLLVNRHLTEAQTVRIPRRLALMSRTSLTGADLLANNETEETVTLTTEALTGELTDPVVETIPPASAVVLVLSETGEPLADAGVPRADGGVEGDAAGGDSSSTGETREQASAGCGCSSAPGAGVTPLALVILAVLSARRKRRG